MAHYDAAALPIYRKFQLWLLIIHFLRQAARTYNEIWIQRRIRMRMRMENGNGMGGIGSVRSEASEA